jgi:hypothetical protein
MSHVSITLEDIDRVATRIRPFPLPADLAPPSRCDFSEIPEETLLSTPPHLIAHMQRTAAQGGFQVVSPRQTPLSSMMTRIKTHRRQLGDHIVGSIADPYSTWPTIDDADFSAILPDEPLPLASTGPTLREKTRTKSLTSYSHMLSDPILSCLVKGRAVIDVLNRHDVQGDGDAVASLLADAWGVEKEDIMDLDAFSLGFEGEMLRHAIKVDEVHPVIYAPIHQRRCISVGASEISRECLPADSAMDWRRMRVFCEAIFALTISIEGIPMVAVRAVPPPGDMTAPADRQNILAFLPAPCTAWSHSADTFALSPVVDIRRRRHKTIPREVLAALARYVEVIRPVSHAMSHGFRATARLSTLHSVDVPPGETLQSSYHTVVRQVGTHGARGRTAAATVRSFVFEAIEALPPAEAMRINRYIQLAKKEVLEHLSLMEVPEVIVDRLACKFLTVGEKIRLKVTAEAKHRGATSEEWWKDITSQSASRYKEMKEGTMGWAKVAMYLLFKQPTDKWRKLCSAINYSSMMESAARSVGGIPLPPEKESIARVEMAARHVAKSVSGAYAGHYMGVYDVGMAISDYMMASGKQRSAEILRQASYLWVLRARVFRAINVNILPGSSESPNVNHYTAVGKCLSINLAPAPYRVYAAYRIGALKSDIIPERIKKQLPTNIVGRISTVFKDMIGPIIPIRESELTKYLIEPRKLGDDMEKAWRELVGDMKKVLEEYGPKEARRPSSGDDVVIQMNPGICLSLPRPVAPSNTGKRGFFEILSEISGEGADYVDSLLEEVGTVMGDMIMEEEFTDANELILRLKGVVAEQSLNRPAGTETVK